MQTKIVSEIIKHSPDNEEVISDLFRSDDNFHSLCIDLLDCKTMIIKLRMENSLNKELLNEYTGLFYALREELNSTISKHIIHGKE